MLKQVQHDNMEIEEKIYIAGCGSMLGEGFHKIFKDEYEL